MTILKLSYSLNNNSPINLVISSAEIDFLHLRVLEIVHSSFDFVYDSCYFSSCNFCALQLSSSNFLMSFPLEILCFAFLPSALIGFTLVHQTSGMGQRYVNYVLHFCTIRKPKNLCNRFCRPLYFLSLYHFHTFLYTHPTLNPQP